MTARSNGEAPSIIKRESWVVINPGYRTGCIYVTVEVEDGFVPNLLITDNDQTVHERGADDLGKSVAAYIKALT